MATDLESAYAAGLFDGEGCVQFYMRPNTRMKGAMMMALSMSSIDPTTMMWMHERWGGSLKTYDEPWRITRNYRPLHRWIIYSLKAEAFARDIYPYLITKRPQMELWLRAREMVLPRGTKGVTDEQLQERLSLVEQIKILKKVAA